MMQHPDDQRPTPDVGPAQPFRGYPEMMVTAGEVIIILDAPHHGSFDLVWTAEERVLKARERRGGPGLRLTIALPVRVRPGFLVVRCRNGVHEVRLEPAPAREKPAARSGRGFAHPRTVAYQSKGETA